MHRFLATALSFLLLIAVFSFSPPNAEAQTTPACHPFNRDLRLGQASGDVKALQELLNSTGFQVSSSGAGSPGLETNYFGSKTKLALIKFQSAKNIYPTSGFFGPLTRGKIKALCASSEISVPPQTGIGSGNGISALAPILPPVTSTTTSTPEVTVKPTGTINPRSIVGILCTIRNGNQVHQTKGSGVIVNQQGYVLTARHLVDPKWTLSAYDHTLTPEQKNLYANTVLERCQVGLPEEITLPDATSIRSINPSALITRNFQYEADLFHLPSANGMSSLEYNVLDAAILKITAPTPTCVYFNSKCNELGRFPYSPVGTEMPQANLDEILSYGYPADGGVNDAGQSFYDFYLKGAVGQVGVYLSGDQKFSGSTLQFSFKSNNIQGGRSGSPIFWKGKVIGILFGSTSTQESYNVSMSAIISSLKDAGYGWVLATE